MFCRLQMPALLLGVLLSLAGCEGVIRPAEMALPAGLDARTEIVPFLGIGGGTSGRFQVGAHSGRFRRSETRLTFFDAVDRRAGSTAFTLRGPRIDGQIEADCRMRARALTFGSINIDTHPMAYACEFTTNGRRFPARFEIQEVREGLGGMLSKAERRGEIALDRVILQIRSVHDLEGSPLDLATPIGYVFALDGISVGAVELNGTPRLFLPVAGDAAVVRAIIAGATALALFWDPAESDL